MYNYHADVIWGIDKALLIVIIFFGIFDILYTAVKEAIENRAIRRLAVIKRNLQDLASSGAEAVKNVCPVIIGKITSQEFLEIARDKELAASKEFSQELRECFIASGKIIEIEREARASGNKWRRIQAIISLGYTDSPAALEILKDSLTDRDEDISYFSMLALSQIKNNSSARILLDHLGKHIYSGNRIIALLEKFPASVIDEAIKATESEDPIVRFWAVKLISRIKSKDCLQRIKDLTKDNSDDVRAAACECLGKMGAKEGKDAAVSCLSYKIWFVRMHAVRAVAMISGEESIPEIAGFIKDESWLVRDTVKRVMAQNIEASLPHIEKFIREDNMTLKKDCVEMLEDSGYLGTLFKDLLSRDEKLKNKALYLLKEIVTSGAHLGLEDTLAGLGKESRNNILQVVATFNRALAEHIDKKIKHEIVEA